MAESLVEMIWFLQISDLKPAVILNVSAVVPVKAKLLGILKQNFHPKYPQHLEIGIRIIYSLP